MKLLQSSLVFSPVLIGLLVILNSFAPSGKENSWSAPKSADGLINPVKPEPKSLEEGKKLYNLMCAVCHGEKGRGDGVAASGLATTPADHSSEKVQNQTDGAIYWKLTYGNPPMAAYEKQLTENQRWVLVNYIRALKSKSKK